MAERQIVSEQILHSELITVLYGDTDSLDDFNNQLEIRYVEEWLGDFFLDDPNVEESISSLSKKMNACISAIKPETPITITGIHRLYVEGPIEVNALDRAGEIIIEAASQDFDIEYDESGDSHITVVMNSGDYIYTLTGEGDFWTERTWEMEGHDSPIQEVRLTREQLDLIEGSGEEPVTSDIDYKLSFTLRIEKVATAREAVSDLLQ